MAATRMPLESGQWVVGGDGGGGWPIVGWWVVAGLWCRNDKEQTGRKQHSKQLPLMSSFFFWPNDNDPTSSSSETTMTLTFAAYCIPPRPLVAAHFRNNYKTKARDFRALQQSTEKQGTARSTLNVERIKNT